MKNCSSQKKKSLNPVKKQCNKCGSYKKSVGRYSDSPGTRWYGDQIQVGTRFSAPIETSPGAA